MQWMSPDPIGYEGGDVNLYRFVGNDPVNNVDPMGLYVESDQFIVDHMPTNVDPTTSSSLVSEYVCGLWGGCANWVLLKRYIDNIGGKSSLKEMGILGQFLNTSSVMQAISDIHDYVRIPSNCEGGTLGKGYGLIKPVDLTWEIYAIGNTAIRYQFLCKGRDCEIDYKLDDPFVDLLDMWEIVGSRMNSGSKNKWAEPIGTPPLSNRWNNLWNPGGKPYQIVDFWSERIKK